MSFTHGRPRHGQIGAGNGLAASEGPASWISLAAWVGIAGPVLFTAMYMIQEAFRTDEYSPIAEPVSALEAGPYGWVQQVNFVVFGLLTIAFAVGLHRRVQQTTAGILGPALLFISGIGLLLAAIFPLREDATGATYDPGGHVVAGLTFFLSSALGLIVLSRRLAHDPSWRSIAMYTLVAGAVALAGFILMGRFVMPDRAPLHDFAGLAQRMLILFVVFPCRIVLSFRLLRLSK
ncbi:hypothetical protein BH23ACT12_BH23ACT12_06350 [soil metagenome]